MKINIISIGHKPPTWAEEGCKEYLKRFQRDLSIVLTELKPAFRVSDTDKNHLARAKEKGRILTKLNKNARLIALDEAGTQTTTNELARLLTNWMAEGRDLDFVIGGADGLDPEIKNQADKNAIPIPNDVPSCTCSLNSNRTALSRSVYYQKTPLPSRLNYVIRYE